MNFKLLLLGTVVLNSAISFAQNGTDRLEFDLKEDYENQKVFSLQEKGLLIQSTATKASKGQLEVKNDFYDTNLNLLTSESMFVKERTDIIDSYQTNGINYSLIRNKRDYVAIVIADINNKSVRKIESEYTDEGTLTEMKVYNDKAIFKSVVHKQNKIVIIDLKSGTAQEVTFKFGDFRRTDIQIEDFQVLDNEVLVFVNAKNSRKSNDLYIASLDLNGSQKEFYKVTDNIEEKLIEVAATKVGSKYILTGTYSKTRSDMSQGLFMAEVDNKKLNFIKFYNFIDLKNFTSYMSEKQQRKVERKVENATDRNKELLLNYFIENHPVKVTADGYIFLGEAFYPTYIVYHNGNSSYTQFDGYFYTHAVIAKFSKTGDLIWDNSFEIKPGYKPMTIKRFISMNENKEAVDLSFGNLEEIVYKKVDAENGNTLINDTTEIIDTKLQGDKIRRSFSEVNYWYGDYFVAFGSQTISNNEKERKRKIFFVNKLTVNK